jgi:hypothetical protein
MSTPDPHWLRIYPGLYVDGDDALHVYAEELLRFEGTPDTPENRAAVERELVEMVHGLFPGIPTHYVNQD